MRHHQISHLTEIDELILVCVLPATIDWEPLNIDTGTTTCPSLGHRRVRAAPARGGGGWGSSVREEASKERGGGISRLGRYLCWGVCPGSCLTSTSKPSFY